MPVIPAFRTLRQEDHESEASLGSIVTPVSKIKQKQSIILHVSIILKE
jgi:hypothetical protein